MDDLSTRTRAVVFGPFEADLCTQELRKKGLPVRLSSQSFQVLRLLLARPGELVTRQELQKALWPNDSFGDFEHGLNAAVNRLRDAIGDSAENPHFIETLPRRGYRFIGDIRTSQETDAAPPHPLVTPSPPAQSAKPEAPVVPLPTPTGSNAPSTRLSYGLIALALLLAALIGLGAILRTHRRSITAAKSVDLSAVQPVPLTALVGSELNPSLSPDGSQVVFSWDQGHPDELADLYVKVVGSEHVQQLTHAPAEYLTPVWSPDGRTIAFLRLGEHVTSEGGLFIISALGGPERRLIDGTNFSVEGFNSIDWLPDSQRVVFSDTSGIKSVDVNTGEVNVLCGAGPCRSSLPAVSPDGQWIAFTSDNNDFYSIQLMPSRGGSLRKVFDLYDGATPVVWTADSRQLVFEQNCRLVTMPATGGPPQFLGFTHDVLSASLSRDGRRLAYAQLTGGNQNLWKLEVSGSRRGSASLLEATSTSEREPDISPDGKRLAFVSGRSGLEQVWAADIDGSNAVQLTHAHELTGSPRWSPDGKLIAFDSRDTGHAVVYVVEPGSGVPRAVATENLDASIPTWSRDGRWIYFRGQAGSTTGVYKVALAGGKPQLLSQSDGWNAQESRDGKSLYFAVGSGIDNEIHVLALSSGKEEKLSGMPRVRIATEWSLGSRGIYFVDWKREGIGFFDLASQRVDRTLRTPKRPGFWGGFSLAPDESWVAYSQLDLNESDLMLLEGFR